MFIAKCVSYVPRILMHRVLGSLVNVNVSRSAPPDKNQRVQSWQVSETYTGQQREKFTTRRMCTPSSARSLVYRPPDKKFGTRMLTL